MRKIKLNDDIVQLIRDSSLNVSQTLNKHYANELYDFKEKYKGSKDANVFDMIFFENNINRKQSLQDIKNTITTADSDFLIPIYVQATIEEMLEKNDLLQYILANTTTVNSTSVKGFNLDLNDPKNQEASRMVRVTEGADLPLAKLSLGSSAINLYKYGRAVNITYEALRRMPIDVLKMTMDAVARDIGQQNIWGATETALNGDGNDNPAINLGKTATNGVITADEMTKFLYKFQELNNGLSPTTILVPFEDKYSLSNFTYDSGLSQGLSNMYRFNDPQMKSGEIQLIGVKNMPLINGERAIVGLERSDGIIKYVEAGSQIAEVDGAIRNQTILRTMSETSGFGKFNKNSAAYLSLGVPQTSEGQTTKATPPTK